ncbi:hypothetical protein NC653_006080 [Populus alba x Populus x berolinensis]|uniref:Uncharacterized protein n=1 Tax=Populus alba x Populus x berolinensis TaxID=444605 RepID=A0AAD6WBR3_9ROSI|nr:hypothetical protein NC653_006080 [Populus alba x Populus x berolinensis]
MKQRYVGHCNVGTDIKRASFLGQRGDSYSGNALCVRFEECCDPFLLEKLIRHSAIARRSSLVLCVQQQLDIYIRNTVVFVLFEIGDSDYMAGVSDDGRWFIWEKRTGRLIKMLLGDEAGSFLSPCDSVCPFELLERFRMHEFTEGTLHLLSVLRANRACALLSLQLAAEVQVEPFFSSKNIRAKVSAT